MQCKVRATLSACELHEGAHRGGCYRLVSCSFGDANSCVTYAAHSIDTQGPCRQAYSLRNYGKNCEFERNVEDEDKLQGKHGRFMQQEP